MDDEQDRVEAPPAALGRARRDTGEGDEGNGDDDDAEEPREADGELEVDVPEIDGGPNVESDGGDGVPAPIVRF